MTIASKFIYDKIKKMKNILEKIFPLLVAALTFIFYQIVYQPASHSLEMAISIQMFFTAAAWSAMIFLSRERQHWLRYFYALLAFLLSILLVEVIRFSRADLLLQRMIYSFNLLGSSAIEYYLYILRNKQKKTLGLPQE